MRCPVSAYKTLTIAAGCLAIAIVAYVLMPASYEIKNENPQGNAIVCFGDSLTYGTGAAKGMDYPSQLSRLIHMEVVNAGVPGDTTALALKRVDAVIGLNPRIVLITLGGNDLKNRVKKEVAFKNLERIVTRFQDHGALVIIGGIKIPLWGKGFNDAYEDLAKKTGSVLIPNIFKDIMGKSGLMSDAIHPNQKGYTLMAQHFYKAGQPYF